MKTGTVPSVLVVDDFATMRRVVRGLLRDLGYDSISEAEDADQAWAQMLKAVPDLLIMDWNMPGVPGADFIQKIRSEERFAKLPVLVLLAEAKQDRIDEAMAAGASGFVVKPFTARVLKQKISQLLG